MAAQPALGLLPQRWPEPTRPRFAYPHFYGTNLIFPQRASIKQVTQNQMEEPVNWNFLTDRSGLVTYYKIPEMSDAERTDLQKWFKASLTNAVGPNRAEVLFQNALPSPIFWLGKGEHEEIAFRDSPTSNTGGPITEWDSVTYNSSGGSAGSDGTSKGKVAPEWIYLFTETNGGRTITSPRSLLFPSGP